MKHRLDVWKSGAWTWLCTCDDWGHGDTQPSALAAGLAHLELWHNDPARRPA
jgi:hypothetical protein